MTDLPTPAVMLTRAQNKLDRASMLLSDARDELNSDWPPGCVMTDAQAERRLRMFRAIEVAKAAIGEARR